MVAKLNVKLVSLSLVAVSVAISLLCAFFIAVAPAGAIGFLGSIFHGIDLSKISTTISWSGVLKGLIAVSITAFITGWLFAVIYNFFSNKLK